MDTLTTDFVRAGSLEELKAKGRLVITGHTVRWYVHRTKSCVSRSC